MMEGGRKYGTHNFRAVGVRASVYYDAIMRHVTQWWEGEDIDLDSGLHPLIKAAASIVVMRDGMLMDNYIDDRPIKYPNGLNMSEFNEKAGDIIEKIPDCVPPYLEKNEKKFVCPEGWEIVEINNAGWEINRPTSRYNYFLWKDFTIHRDSTGWLEFITEHKCDPKFGEAPAYWPTKEAAEVALIAYLTKIESEVIK